MSKNVCKVILVMFLLAGFLLPNPLLFAKSTTKVNSEKEIESVFVTTKTMLNSEEAFSLANRQGVRNDLAQLQAGDDDVMKSVFVSVLVIYGIIWVSGGREWLQRGDKK